MKLKLFLLLTMLVSATGLWAQTGVQGTVIDAKSGLPVVGATVMLDNQGNTVTTGLRATSSLATRNREATCCS